MNDATKSLVIMPENNILCVRVYDIPSNEVNAFVELLPDGSKELTPAIGIYIVPDLSKAEAACDTKYLDKKVKSD